jgi:hypothetical protein
MTMQKCFWAFLLVVPGILGLATNQEGARQTKTTAAQDVSFKADVAPIFKKYCLPCHDEESFNPSELSLDTYDLLMKGGKHGAAVVPGKPSESILIQKLTDTPPFGDPMPVKSRRKKTSDPPKRLTEEEMNVLKSWIEQGAIKN